MADEVSFSEGWANGSVAVRPREVPSLPREIPSLPEPFWLIETIEIPQPEARPRARRSLLRRLLANPVAWMLVIGAVALTARLVALGTSNDIFIDEITYTNIALSLAHGHGVTVYGQPFELHPPAAFGLFALVISVFALHGGTESVLFALRHVDAVIGSLICVLTFLLVDRAAKRQVAVIAALVLAVDPLANMYDSRVMLEAPAQLAAVAAFLCLAVAAGAPASTSRRWRWLFAAALASAVVFCTKETFGLVVGVALVILVVTGWVVSRREAATVLGVALVGYGVSVVSMGLTYGFGVWWNDQIGGASRLVGTDQITGFNSSQVHVSIVSRFLADMPTLAICYVILAFGIWAAVGLLIRLKPWKPRPTAKDPRALVTILLAIWTVSAAGYLVYATLIGTIEEQMYYILLLPSIISLCLWFADEQGTRPSHLKQQSHHWRKVGVVVAAVALLFDAVVWAGVHTSQDDEYRQMLAWEAVHVPPTAVVSATEGLSQFLLSRGEIGQWSTIPQLQAHHVDYVIVNVSLVNQGYGLASTSFLNTLEHRARVVYQVSGQTDVSLRIYDVRSITGSSS